jgi:predicted ATPase/class 3 adenylate cyclase
MARLPSGTVTFLYTDVEGSTRLVQHLGERYVDVLADHRRLIRAAVQERNGHEVSVHGDACLAVFARAQDAVAAAIAAQRAFAAFQWPPGIAVRVRMGLHTGTPLRVGADYVGIDVHVAARLGAAGHGGQILLSEATHALVRGASPADVGFHDLGEYRLKDLAHSQRVFQVVAPDLMAEFPPLEYPETVPNNLPVQLTSFVGRAREIGELKGLLATTRLLTVTGPGGIGKTRLALQVAADELKEYKDGVWLVELASLSDPTLVAQTVAGTLRVHEIPGRPIVTTVADSIGSKQLLLLLDNCEHLVAACAGVADGLLRACPRLRIIATSREALGVAGETSWRLFPLSLADIEHLPPLPSLSQYEAIHLFADRAAAAAPTFSVSEENARAVAWVCRQLDGIPLALELAAARVKVLSVHEIAGRLEDRFRLLANSRRTTPARHQTLRATMDWSFNLLSESERTVLRRLSVFAGGCKLESAEVVCAGDGVECSRIVDLIARLAEQSLVSIEDRAGETRYRLLDTVRQYCREKLEESGETAGVRGRHGEWFLEFAERAEPKLLGEEQSLWLQRLEAEHDNLREALEWFVNEPATDAGLRLAKALFMFWSIRGFLSEGRKWLEQTLAQTGGVSSPVRVRALRAAGFLAYYQHDYSRAAALAQDALAQAEAAADKALIANAHYLVGFIAVGRADWSLATRQFQQSLALFRELEDKRGIGISFNMLGEVARNEGDYAAARSFYEQDLSLRREIRDERGVAISLHNLGHVARHAGDYAGASELFKESLAIRLRLGHKLGVANCLAGLGGVAAGQNRCDLGAKLLGATKALLRSIGAELDPVDRLEFGRTESAVKDALPSAAFEAALLEGSTMPLERAVENALSV